MTNDRIIDRIRKLLALAEGKGATPGEAAAAAAQAQRLMLEHNVERLQLQDAPQEEIVSEEGWRRLRRDAGASQDGASPFRARGRELSPMTGCARRTCPGFEHGGECKHALAYRAAKLALEEDITAEEALRKARKP